MVNQFEAIKLNTTNLFTLKVELKVLLQHPLAHLPISHARPVMFLMFVFVCLFIHFCSFMCVGVLQGFYSCLLVPKCLCCCCSCIQCVTSLRGLSFVPVLLFCSFSKCYCYCYYVMLSLVHCKIALDVGLFFCMCMFLYACFLVYDLLDVCSFLPCVVCVCCCVCVLCCVALCF